MSDEFNHELISAALDGEHVDVQALKGALSTADGRDALASFLLLRAAMAADTMQPPSKAVPAVIRERGGGRRSSFGFGVRIPFGVAASIVVFAAAASFWLGTVRHAGDFNSGSGRTSTQTSAVAAQPSSDPPSSFHQQETAPGVPPTPTRVLRFTPGVDWHPAS
jgi:hypothetical protein